MSVQAHEIMDPAERQDDLRELRRAVDEDRTGEAEGVTCERCANTGEEWCWECECQTYCLHPERCPPPCKDCGGTTMK